MSVGPKDNIDRALARKYASEKVDNPTMVKMVDSQKMLDTMNDYALMHKNMLALNQRLKDACAALNSKTAMYKPKRKIAGARP